MSSASLRRTPEPSEHFGPVRDALTEVAESSFFTYVDGIDASAFAELATATASWLRVSVTFSGAFGGTMAVTLPEPLARDLFASFLGLDAGEFVEDARLFDLVGELGNMVCGAWLTRTCRRRHFDLQHPAVARLDAAVFPKRDVLQVAVSGQPVWVELAFTGC